ncbi:transglycosylase SLT domain-containing protein [Acetobacter okinawensis]|nr:transglycosylase SLT domain-containing protein [Acetobacter okinawensis]MCP1213814.1 transglycosylase SLT domain-containing protein [Acetobacter okinawensis]
MMPPVCLHEIANFYHLADGALLRIVKTEHSAAIGPMGIQEGWLPILEKAGFHPELVRNDVCTNIAAGAWILVYVARQKKEETPPKTPDIASPPLQQASLSGSLRSCAIDAANQYRISVPLFLGILATEGGRVGQTVRNHNGTYDMGPAQINSSHLPELANKGITRDQIVNDGCLNVHIGAWILARELGNETPLHPKEFWQRVGNYNSRTPEYNQAYQLKVWKHVISLPHSQPNG